MNLAILPIKFYIHQYIDEWWISRTSECPFLYSYTLWDIVYLDTDFKFKYRNDFQEIQKDNDFLSFCLRSQAPSFPLYVWVECFPLSWQCLDLQLKTVYRKTSTIFDQEDNPVSIQGLHERNLRDKLQTVGFWSLFI